ncbi:MAG: AraC family transcriptional regulator [Bacteroidaceae bacterium]|nr:AraC family transcriptional regulator [Bacteroidaceae bacterium]
MREKKNVLDFSKLPETISEAKIDGKIMLMDNIGGEEIRADRKEAIQGYCFPTHSELTILVLCLKGNVRFRLNLKEETVNSYEVFIILPRCIFEVQYVSPDFVGAVLLSAPEDMLVSEDTVVDMAMRRYVNSHHTLKINPNNFDHYMNLYANLKRTLIDHTNPFRGQITRKYCQILVYEAWNDFMKNTVSQIFEHSRKQEIFDAFIHCVEKNFIKERRIQFYADQLHLSAKYLSCVIKEVSNKFASDWVDEYVLLEAKALLKQPNITILQISDRLNFPNQSFFGRYFKHHTGYSPKEYRKL